MMRALTLVAFLAATSAVSASQQPAQDQTSTTRLIPFSGTLPTAGGNALVGPHSVAFSLFDEPEGGTLLWTETQHVTADERGRYAAYLGATLPLPLDIFRSERARWLEVSVNGRSLPRMMLVTVPYALHAADAATLGGKPASSFVLAGPDGGVQPSDRPSLDGPAVDGGGVAHQLAKWTGSASLGSSIIGESLDNRVAINTTDPTGGGVVDALVTLRSTDNKTGFAILNQSHAPRFAINTLPTGGWSLFDGSASLWYQGLTQWGGRVTLGSASPTGSARLNVIQKQSIDEAAIFARKQPPGNQTYGILARSAPAVLGPVIAGIAGSEANLFYDAAVLGATQNANSIGVMGYAPVTGGIGIQGTGTLYGGYFVGDVHVTGALTKGGGAFQIDHPLDPENKYLRHSFVESPDMMNVYNGNVKLDANGEARVRLPDWFEALNGDFRYQLTSIGSQANPYIAEEVKDNTFKIAGGSPDGKVSWQVTGIRRDAWANAHRIVVEEDKSDGERAAHVGPTPAQPAGPAAPASRLDNNGVVRAGLPKDQ